MLNVLKGYTSTSYISDLELQLKSIEKIETNIKTKYFSHKVEKIMDSLYETIKGINETIGELKGSKNVVINKLKEHFLSVYVEIEEDKIEDIRKEIRHYAKIEEELFKTVNF